MKKLTVLLEIAKKLIFLTFALELKKSHTYRAKMGRWDEKNLQFFFLIVFQTILPICSLVGII